MIRNCKGLAFAHWAKPIVFMSLVILDIDCFYDQGLPRHRYLLDNSALGLFLRLIIMVFESAINLSNPDAYPERIDLPSEFNHNTISLGINFISKSLWQNGTKRWHPI